MADKPKTNVDKFFEIYDADPALQARVQQAMDCYPGRSNDEAAFCGDKH